MVPKPEDHRAIFAELELAVKDERAIEASFIDREDLQTGHFFKFINQITLNKSNPDFLVNVLEYCKLDKNGEFTTFSWVTDIEITEENVNRLLIFPILFIPSP